MNKSSFRDYLRQELINRCKRNPSYSLRSFARFLEMDHSTLGKVLNGKRPLGKNLIKKIGNKLDLNPNELSFYLEIGRSDNLNEETFDKLAYDSFQVIADWYHSAILELIRVNNFKSDPKWIAKCLGISVHEVQSAIERLERVQLIFKNYNGEIQLSSKNGKTFLNPGFTSSAHKLLQRQILEKAILALEHIPLEIRNQTSVTMAIDRHLLPEAIRRITIFRSELVEFLSRTQVCNEVYQMSICLFPLTQSYGDPQ